jgi:hypothetical protein
MKLALIGPNLYDQTKGTFHVHTASCKDGLNSRKYPLSERWEEEHDSRMSVCRSTYWDQIHSDTGYAEGSAQAEDLVAAYVDDFYFHACTKALPLADPQAAPQVQVLGADGKVVQTWDMDAHDLTDPKQLAAWVSELVDAIASAS